MQTKGDADSQTNNDEDDNGNEQAPPFQTTSTAGVCDTLVELNVAGLRVLLNVLGVLLGLLDHGFLNDNGLGEILEELVQLDQSALNLLNVVVTSTHSAKDSAGSSGTVGLEL